ncbi:MAG: site-specific DNA-methyltransferase [Methanolinea sp.]|nr:site-specific DNA-methyltransferase [Methanolinea sp.]
MIKPEFPGFSPDTIYQGDALELLPRLPSGCIDIIVTDPPFAIDFRARRGNYNRTGSRVLEGYREVDAGEYQEFTSRWMSQAFRVLSPRGSIYVFSGWNRLKEVLIGLDQAGFHTINHLIWKFQFGVFTRRRYVTSHYHILYAVKNPRDYTFHKQDHYPEDVWVIPREYWKGRKKTPTKLPCEIVRRILSYSSDPGDIVLDPFLGSGTVALVASEMGRHFIGFEVVPGYFQFALARLAGRAGACTAGKAGEKTGNAEGEN